MVTPTKRYETTFDFLISPRYRDFEIGLRTDGLDDYLTLSNNLLNGSNITQTIWHNTTFSISVWVKGNFYISLQRNQLGEADNYTFDLRYLSTFNLAAIGLQTNTQGTKQSVFNGIPNTVNKWTHVVFVQNGNSFTADLYVDGIRLNDLYVNSGSNTYNGYFDGLRQDAQMNSFNGGRFGINPPPSYNNTLPRTFFTSGVFSDLMFINRTLTKAEIWQIFKNGTNVNSNYITHYPSSVLSSLISHYTFNTPNYTGFTVNDVSGNGNDLTVFNQAALTTENIYLP